VCSALCAVNEVNEYSSRLHKIVMLADHGTMEDKFVGDTRNDENRTDKDWLLITISHKRRCGCTIGGRRCHRRAVYTRLLIDQVLQCMYSNDRSTCKVRGETCLEMYCSSGSSSTGTYKCSACLLSQ
jgi:hypothetical protein